MKLGSLALILICIGAFGQSLPSPIVSNDEIRKILVDRLGPAGSSAGIVVGVIDASGRRVVGFGSFAKGDDRKLDGDTVFEIGSMTKVFTSLLLMDMVRHGEVALSDPISKFLPASVKVPERNGRKITLADLSTQTSGLPRMPTNFAPKDDQNPYADYSVQQMYDFISGYQLTRDIGEKYEYSNLGVGLLGHVLSLRAGKPYEELVIKRICEPLGMKDTRVTLSSAMTAKLAPGHTETLEVTKNWDIPTLAGAGALRSTANDMLKFLAANLGMVKSPLAQAMSDEVAIRKPTGTPGIEIAYGWHVQTKDSSTIIWHNGGTGGYRTYMGYDPQAKTGVVVLTNLSTAAGQDDIGRHLLNPAYPLAKIEPPKEHKEATSVDPASFDKFTGDYQLAPGVVATMSREGSHFYTQLTGQPKFEIFPENERKYFLKVVDAQLTFAPDGSLVTLHQGGRDMPAKRMAAGEAEAAAAKLAERTKANQPGPGSEAALRRSISELQKGEPNYAMMSQPLADAMRSQVPQMKGMFDQFGALKTVKFQKVGPAGVDVFDVSFEHANTEWMILVDTDGKIQTLGLHPVQ